MGAYLVRRFLLMVLTLFGMSVLIFVMLRLVPGDISDILVDAAGIADAKEKAKIAHELGLDKPIPEQYAEWIGGLARGDLGYAYVSERPAIEEIAPRIPISSKLAGLALFFAVVAVHVASLVLVHFVHAFALLVVALGGRHRLGRFGLFVAGRWLVLCLRRFLARFEVGLHRRLFGLGAAIGNEFYART